MANSETIIQAESSSMPGVFYTVDLAKATCTCPLFKYSKGPCKHLKEAMVANPVACIPVSNPAHEFMRLRGDYTPIEVQPLIENYDKWLRTRVSKNFMLRDFMFHAYGSIMGIPNIPEHPELIERSARELGEKVCEPVLAKFGSFAITYGYASREIMSSRWPEIGPTKSSPHNWDRGTYGQKVYARMDILPYAVEDGEVSRADFGSWMMHNLDIDLLMQWDSSNVYCISVAPRPRRVWLEWCKNGSGDNHSNKRTYMGEKYWMKDYPALPQDKRPKFAPSFSGGKMY